MGKENQVIYKVRVIELGPRSWLNSISPLSCGCLQHPVDDQWELEGWHHPSLSHSCLHLKGVNLLVFTDRCACHSTLGILSDAGVLICYVIVSQQLVFTDRCACRSTLGIPSDAGVLICYVIVSQQLVFTDRCACRSTLGIPSDAGVLICYVIVSQQFPEALSIQNDKRLFKVKA